MDEQNQKVNLFELLYKIDFLKEMIKNDINKEKNND